MKTLIQINKQIAAHKYVERNMSALIHCPICGKIISTRFPMHECKPKVFPSLLQSAEDERREDLNEMDRGDLRDEGRSDGHGESYAERNA